MTFILEVRPRAQSISASVGVNGSASSRAETTLANAGYAVRSIRVTRSPDTATNTTPGTPTSSDQPAAPFCRIPAARLDDPAGITHLDTHLIEGAAGDTGPTAATVDPAACRSSCAETSAGCVVGGWPDPVAARRRPGDRRGDGRRHRGGRGLVSMAAARRGVPPGRTAGVAAASSGAG